MRGKKRKDMRRRRGKNRMIGEERKRKGKKKNKI